MKICKDCGIFDEAASLCAKYQTAEPPGRVDCYFFTPIRREDGERLSPQYHLILREAELKSKQMQGPV